MIFVFCGDILTTINRVVLFRFVTQGRIRIMTGAATERVRRERERLHCDTGHSWCWAGAG